MLLIFCTQSSPRLQYTCKTIFTDILAMSYSITTDEINFRKHDAEKINYSSSSIEGVFQIFPHSLLFENNITPQQTTCFTHNNNKAFFKTEQGNYPFDIFAATFYLISRYEEYLPHIKDLHVRYAHTNSLAFSEGFLKLPLINIWLHDFKNVMLQNFSGLVFNSKPFSFTPTYDIDMGWSYKHKGLVRNVGGFLKSPSFQRLSTLIGAKKDPFDSYEILHQLHRKYNLQPIYFFLVSLKNSEYDKNILPSNPAMQLLIQQHAAKYTIGLHPSWQSNIAQKIIEQEKNILQQISATNIINSRQHYIKLTLPKTYQQLISIGIVNDYSMGYGSINGFRASVASSFYWYDLVNENSTSLRIHPFCFMDANCFYEQKFTVQESAEQLAYYYNICKQISGNLITIFHNNFIGTSKEFLGWKNLYETFLAEIA